jgi:hypothetical protein
MAEYVDYFLEIGLQDATLLDTSPSLLGAAVVAAAMAPRPPAMATFATSNISYNVGVSDC